MSIILRYRRQLVNLLRNEVMIVMYMYIHIVNSASRSQYIVHNMVFVFH